MARSRKKSMTARVLREATRGLPAPIQFAAASPLRLAVSTGVLATLVSYGVVNVNWDSGRPQLEVNQEKADELRERTQQWVEKQRGEIKFHAEPAPPEAMRTAQQDGRWTIDPRGVNR